MPSVVLRTPTKRSKGAITRPTNQDQNIQQLLVESRDGSASVIAINRIHMFATVETDETKDHHRKVNLPLRRWILF